MRATGGAVQRPGERFPRERELAWRLAEVAADPAPVEPAVAEMVGNRLLDDVAVALPALDRGPPAAARGPRPGPPRPGRGPGAGPAPRPGPPPGRAGPPCSASTRRAGWRPSGRPGPTARPCASSTSTTPSWPPTSPTPGTTSPRCWRSPRRAADQRRAYSRGL